MDGGIFWLASYPKSGNTWTRSFIVALTGFAQSDEQELDINELTTGAIASSRQWIESGLGLSLEDNSRAEIDLLRPLAYRFWHQQARQPQYHKVHDAYVLNAQQQPLFPADAAKGVLYIVRHPYDVAVSLAHHNGTSLQHAVDEMCNSEYCLVKHKNKINFQVEQRLLNWSQHVSSWLDSPHRVHLMRYEDMHSQAEATFSNLVDFLEISADNQQIKQAIAASSFKKLQAKELQQGFREKSVVAERFFRSGEVGEGRHKLSVAQQQQLADCHAVMMQRMGYQP